MKRDVLMNTYQYIYREIFQELEFFCKCSIQEAANKLFVSLATMHRAVKSFGFDSYSSFRIFLNDELVKKISTNKATTSKDKIERVFESYKTTIDCTYDLINAKRDKFNDLKNAILGASKVLSFGIGASSIAAKNLEKRSLLSGGNVYCAEDFYSTLKVLCNVDNIFAILFSRSGVSTEIFFCIKKMIEMKIPFLLVTDNENHPLKEKIPFFLLTKSIKRKNRATEISSKISQLLISDLLAEVILPEIDNKKVEQFDKLIDEW